MTRWSLFLQTLSLLHHFLGLYYNWICLCRIFGENTYGFLASDHPEPVTLCNLVIAEQHWDEFVGQMVDRWQDLRDRVIPETNRMVMEGFTLKEARNCVVTPSTSS